MTRSGAVDRSKMAAPRLVCADVALLFIMSMTENTRQTLLVGLDDRLPCQQQRDLGGRGATHNLPPYAAFKTVGISRIFRGSELLLGVESALNTL